jgi:alpha-L-rhamnosidase
MKFSYNKSQLFLVVFIMCLFLLASCSIQESPVKINKLSCEFLLNPIGIETQTPRFNWQMESNINGMSQQAYQIIIDPIN